MRIGGFGASDQEKTSRDDGESYNSGVESSQVEWRAAGVRQAKNIVSSRKDVSYSPSRESRLRLHFYFDLQITLTR